MEYKWNILRAWRCDIPPCLNPCFNGIQMEHFTMSPKAIDHCLNPCFNGIQMERLKKQNRSSHGAVLFLVLMEYKWN